MRALVVYESLWGNTAAIARAIAEGIGEGARAVPTSAASADLVSGTDLIVAGAPLLGFSLPSEGIRTSIRSSEKRAPAPPDLSHPSMRSWLQTLEPADGRSAAFETRIWWSPGSAMRKIAARLQALGYAPVAKPQAFIVTGRYGPLRDGELERAQAWGRALRESVR